MSEVIICGPAGRIEGRYHHNPAPNAPLALVLHPHPLHGGTMNNKVVYSIYKAYVESGFSVLRFNSRGVGRSEGVYDNGDGELADAAAALDWMQVHNPGMRRFWIGGFSFGALLSMQILMRRPEITGFTVVSPPANSFDFNFLAPCPVSGMMIHGGLDDIVPIEHVNQLVDKLNAQKGVSIDYRVLENADHFFKEDLDTIKMFIKDYIVDAIQVPVWAPISKRGRSHAVAASCVSAAK